jgi:Flp pilus assembly protein TadB
VVFLILILSAPDYFSVMFGPPIMGHFLGYDIPMGVLMMVGAVTWQLIGAYMIYKIVSVKV